MIDVRPIWTDPPAVRHPRRSDIHCGDQQWAGKTWWCWRVRGHVDGNPWTGVKDPRHLRHIFERETR